MASNTENLNLLMKNPSTDGADTFNVQTMLNENWQKIDNNAGTVAQTLANILKPTTPPIIGLPPSTTPDGMFQALGNTGELHVWRKTTVSTEPVPAGYKLGKIISSGNATDSGVSITGGYTNAGKVHINRFSAVNVSDDGTVTGDTSAAGYSSYPVGQTVPNFDVGGYFISLTETVNGTIWASEIEKDKIYYVPVGSSWFQGPGSALRFCLTSIQEVIGTPYIPVGTTTTYPVSTNPNAYQEGDNAKPAGYTLGEVVTGQFKMGLNDTSNGWNYGIEAEPTVNSDGTFKTLTLNLTTSNFINASNLKTAIAGKFVQLIGYNGYSSPPDTSGPFSSVPGPVIFVPTDVKCTVTNSVLIIDRYQPVTGYAAIPAGTTIEYLGKLGDKARVQVVSYVGTGTYGSDHPNSLTFDFAPKVVVLLGVVDPNGNLRSIHAWDNNYIDIRIPSVTPTTFTAYYGFGQTSYASYQFGRVSTDRKTFYWYGSKSAFSQLNESRYIYYYLGVG